MHLKKTNLPVTGCECADCAEALLIDSAKYTDAPQQPPWLHCPICKHDGRYIVGFNKPEMNGMAFYHCNNCGCEAPKPTWLAYQEPLKKETGSITTLRQLSEWCKKNAKLIRHLDDDEDRRKNPWPDSHCEE